MIQLRTPLYEIERLKQTWDSDFLRIKNKPCNRCDLSPLRNSDCTRPVIPVGNIETGKLLILMQSPGHTEDKYEIPACGPARGFIDEFIKRGLTFDDFVLANALWCHPPNNAKALSRHLKACRYNLSYLITKMKPVLVVLVGDDALKMVEGSDARLDLRAGNPGYVTWFPNDNEKGDPTFIRHEFNTFPMYHPTHIDYMENEYGRVKARQEMYAHINYIVEQYKVLKTGKPLEIPYKHFVAETEEQAHQWIDWLGENAEKLIVDFETWQLAAKTRPVLMSFSWDDYCSVGIWLEQCVDLPENKWHFTKGKKNSQFEMKWELTDWYSDGSAKRIMAHAKEKIFERGGKFIGGQHVQIEMSCCDYYGVKLKPRFTNFSERGAFMLDTMVMMRTVMPTQSVSLFTLLQKSMPLEASQKNWIDEYLTENEKYATGYGLMAIKPDRPVAEIKRFGRLYNTWQEQVREKGLTPAAAKKICDLSAEELAVVEKYWLPGANMLRHELLANRANFDTDLERRLQEKYWILATSNQALEPIAIDLNRMEKLSGDDEE